MELVNMLFLLIPYFVEASAKGTVDIRQTTANKAFMETMRHGEYEVVHPFQIRDKNERIGIDTRNYYLKAQEHYAHVTIVIRSNLLGRLKLVLERNNLVFLNQTAFHKLDSEGERVIQTRVENCYYQGTIGGEESSFVALSSCNGLKGVISFSNGTTFGIWPLDGSERNSRRHPHILYKTDWKKDAKCGTTFAHSIASRIRREAHRHRHHRRHRDASKRTKYVELAMIADYEFVKYNSFIETDVISYMLETINIADFMLSRDLNIRLSAVYVELWMDVQRVDLHDDLERTLSGVVDYSAGHIYHIQKDATVMFTGGSFANSEVGNAGFRSICTARSAIVIKGIDPYATQWSGEVVTQAVGHLLGLEHDTAACSCEPSPECVMRAQPGFDGSPFAFQFSKCSIARMHGIWQDGNVQCLLNKPFQVSELRECGNGIVDGSEECDCGGRERCDDPCCDPLTCTLRAHAQCADHHKCCNRCELKKAGEVCRVASSSCDVAEQCDGRSGDCPPDGHLIDGTVCGRDGQCWRGNCSDAHAQCQDLWGSEAKVGDNACFEQNTRGHEYANCGQNQDGTTRQCRSEDVKCGSLHCQGGLVAPTNAAFKAFTFHFSQNQHQIQCKSIAQLAEGAVRDGSNCGSGRVCVAGSCVEMSSVSAAVACPTNNFALLCSGHGHCTTTAKCVCFSGWSGTACDMRSNTTSLLSSHFDEPHKTEISIIPTISIGTTRIDTPTLLGILGVGGLFFFVSLICLLVCYRRKSVVEIPTPSDEKMDDDLPERSIKFGNMPSYREEKRKRKSNKRVYGALNRITEADERDSTSLRSRDSLSQGNGSQMLFENQRPLNSSRLEQFGDHIYAESAISNCRRPLLPDDIDGYPLRSFGSWRSSAPISPSSSSNGHIGASPLQLKNLGKLLRDMQCDEEDAMSYGDVPGIAALRTDNILGSVGEEELSAVEADHDLGSNTESSRGEDVSESHKSRPWNPLIGNQQGTEFHETSHLFSDSFRMPEMCSSLHD